MVINVCANISHIVHHKNHDDNQSNNRLAISIRIQIQIQNQIQTTFELIQFCFNNLIIFNRQQILIRVYVNIMCILSVSVACSLVGITPYKHIRHDVYSC